MGEARYWAVVPAAGIGRRMGASLPKQYLPLTGQTVIEHALYPLLQHPRIAGVIVAIRSDDKWWETLRIDTSKPLLRVEGGSERCHSVMNALRALRERLDTNDWVLVHDAVRPCLRASDLDWLMDTLSQDPVGGLLAVPVRDTMKRADPCGRVRGTEDRSGLWHALTPQMFRFGVLLPALWAALQDSLQVTDEASAIEAAGLTPRLVQGRADNIKITRSEDLALAEFYLTHGRG